MIDPADENAIADAVTWDNATTSDGEWSGLSLVIDTDTYAGNIEREMLAACTGVVDEYASDEAEEIGTAYDGPDLEDLVSSLVYDPGDDGICRTRVTIYQTPGWSQGPRGGEPYRVTAKRPFKHHAYLSVRIPLRSEPAAAIIDGIKRRAHAFAASSDPAFRVTGFRLIRERVTTQSRDV
jgi:hypothetical protein